MHIIFRHKHNTLIRLVSLMIHKRRNRAHSTLDVRASTAHTHSWRSLLCAGTSKTSRQACALAQSVIIVHIRCMHKYIRLDLSSPGCCTNAVSVRRAHQHVTQELYTSNKRTSDVIARTLTVHSSVQAQAQQNHTRRSVYCDCACGQVWVRTLCAYCACAPNLN